MAQQQLYAQDLYHDEDTLILEGGEGKRLTPTDHTSFKGLLPNCLSSDDSSHTVVIPKKRKRKATDGDDERMAKACKIAQFVR